MSQFSLREVLLVTCLRCKVIFQITQVFSQLFVSGMIYYSTVKVILLITYSLWTFIFPNFSSMDIENYYILKYIII